MFGMELAGTACENLQTLLENAFGFPENLHQQELHCQFLTLQGKLVTANPEEPEQGMVSKTQDVAEAREVFKDDQSSEPSTGTSPSPTAKCKLSDDEAETASAKKTRETLSDKVGALKDATAVYPSASIPLAVTGVLPQSYGSRLNVEGQSIYQC